MGNDGDLGRVPALHSYADDLRVTGGARRSPAPAPRALELFGGCGGAAAGLRAAGVDSVRCVEWDADAHAVALAAGHPSVLGDVRDPAMYDGLGDIDVIWSSFPCQGWSSAGKRRGKDDERNGWPWTVAAIDRVCPRWVLCENVPGLLHHRSGCGCAPRGDTWSDACPAGYFHGTILRQLRERFASVSWATLDAADFGAPQRRKRIILVAGPVAFCWPAPTHSQASLVAAKWISGDYWWKHGIEPRGEPSREERRVLARIERGEADSELALPRWRTVRDALGIGTSIRNNGVGCTGRTSDEPSPAAGTGGTLYAHAEDPGARPRHGRLDRPADALTGGSIRSHVNGRSIVSASAGARAEFFAELGELSVAAHAPGGYRDACTDVPAPTVRPISPHGGAPRFGDLVVIGSNTARAPGPALWIEHPVLRNRSAGDGPGAAPDEPAVCVAATGPPEWMDARQVVEYRDAADRLHRRPCPVRGVRADATTEGLLDHPSPPVLAGEAKGTSISAAPTRSRHSAVQGASDAVYLATGVRRLSIAECAALQGFAPDYPWHAARNNTARYRCIGNAVVPAVAEALGRALVAVDLTCSNG